MTIAHSSQKDRLVASVVNQHWLLDAVENAKEFSPNPPLVLHAVRPQAVLDGRCAITLQCQESANEVVEIFIGQALDVQVNWRAFYLEFRVTCDVDLLLPNCERFQRVVIFLAFVAESLWAAGVARNVS